MSKEKKELEVAHFDEIPENYTGRVVITTDSGHERGQDFYSRDE